MALSDADLVERALAGREDAYEELVVRYQRPLLSLLGRWLGDRALAEDLAQEVFLKAFRALATYAPERKFSSWLFKIAHNAAIDQLRRRGIATEPLEAGEEGAPDRLATLGDDRAESPAARPERRELAAALETAIGGLRREYREVVLLRFREELSYEEVAEVTGLPLGTVKTFLHRARRELAEALAGMGWKA
ncbi:MAG: RNA polymerase sigma factor [Acidobacteriota bacterium]